MRSCLGLGLAWLLQARAPGAAGTPSGPRRPRSYRHLEGNMSWRRLFFTHFFLPVDRNGLVQGFIEICSICMGIEGLKAVHISFVAINHWVHLYGCTVGVAGSGQALAEMGL